jgi:flagella basal body P-ring formation protein FlgA
MTHRAVFAFVALIALTDNCLADAVVPTKTIRAGTIIGLSDVTIDATVVSDTIVHIDDVVGKEAKATLYAGRAISVEEVGPAAVVQRNELVELAYVNHGLTIVVEGRALGRGAPGEIIRAMNMASRRTVIGRIQPSGQILVASSVKN